MKKLTIVLLGKQGAGKSASGNTLLGINPFHTSHSLNRVTQASSMGISTVDEQTIQVIDTPGWCDSPTFTTEMKPNIINFINMYEPHVFLLLLPIGHRFTTEEIKTVINIPNEFGDEVLKYTIVLFTKGDELEDMPIEDYLKEGHKDLNELIKMCNDRYHVFNNKGEKDHQQISSLLRKINDLLEKNDGKCYTKAMYEKNKSSKTLEADKSVPEKMKSSTENEKTHDDQRSSCKSDGKEKGKEKGKTLVDRKELEKFMNMAEQIHKTVMKFDTLIGDLRNDIQKLERKLKTLLEEPGKTKNELHPVEQNLYQNI